MNGGQIGEQVGDLDISGGYETGKCHWACHFPNFPLRSRTVRNCAQERYGQAGSSFAQWNRYNPPLALPSSGERAALARRKKGAFVRKRVKASFDPKEFLAKVGEGKTISKYRKDQVVFSQGQVADAVFYIQQGKVKLTVVSGQGKEAVVAILGPQVTFL